MTPSGGRVTAAVVVIGNEILSGRTRDANLAHLARGLGDVGIQVAEARVIPDVEDVIVATVNELRARHAYVLTTGGIGPTHDDITAAAVAKAIGVPLERNAEAVRRLESHYRDAGGAFELNEARLRMADVPRGATLVENPVSKAPGFRIENVIVLAGVPSIMRAMLDGLKHQLAGGPPVHAREIACFLPEGELAGPLAALQERYPDVDMGSYPFVRDGRFGASVVLRSRDEPRLEAAAGEARAAIRDLGAEPVRVDLERARGAAARGED